MLTLSTVTPAALVAQSLDAVRADLGPVAAVPGDTLHRMAEGEIRAEQERRAPAVPPEQASALALQLDRLGLPMGMIVPTTYRGRVTVQDGRLSAYLTGIRYDYFGDVGALLDLPLYASPGDPEPIRAERGRRMEREALVLAVPGHPDWSQLVVDPKAAHPSDYFYQNVIPADQEDTVRGVFAGYNGKRRMSDDQLYKRSSAFIEGYQSGRQQREKATQPLPPPWKPPEVPTRAPEPAAPPADLRVVEYMDFFKLRDAPYVLEERVGESGRSYTVKVYLPEAYTAAYMIPSDETGRLVRWGVKLNDGRIVSRDGIFRLRFPAAWERIKAKAARARGEARDKLLGEALWGLLTPDEQRAMIASVDLRDFADGRGEKQALADLEDFLKREGSLLAYADHEWWRDISADYSTRLLGGPVGSPAWLGATFAEFTPYKQERAGRPREDLSPETMPVTQSAGKGYIIHPAITDPEYWTPPGKDHPRRAADKAQVFPILRRRFGSVLARVAQDRAARLHNNELPADLPSEYTVEGRLARQAMYAEILRTIDPAWAKGLGPSDRMLEPLINAATRVFMGTPPALWSAPEAPARAPEAPPPAAPMPAATAPALRPSHIASLQYINGKPRGVDVDTIGREYVEVLRAAGLVAVRGDKAYATDAGAAYGGASKREREDSEMVARQSLGMSPGRGSRRR